MRPFIHDDFLLHTDAARNLYRNFARDEPIYDVTAICPRS